MPNPPLPKRKLDLEEPADAKKARAAASPPPEKPAAATSEKQDSAPLQKPVDAVPKPEEKATKTDPEAEKESIAPKKETPASHTSDSATKLEEPASKVSLQRSNPVFGARSSFGKSSIFEKMKNGKSVFDTASPEPETQPTQTQPDAPKSATSSFGSFGGSFGSFGSKSKFSNALQKASQKKSFLDEPDTTPKAESVEPAKPLQQYKQVDLTEQKVATGEENEEAVFSATAKLFELDFSKISEGWKERGLGPLHLNKLLDDSAQVRLVMRSQGLLRVVLNYKITPKTELIKGLEASLNPGKFLRMNAVSPEGTPIQYMLKFSSETVRNGLYDAVEDTKAGMAN